MKCTPALYEVDKELGFVCLKWSSTYEKDLGPVAAKELKN